MKHSWIIITIILITTAALGQQTDKQRQADITFDCMRGGRACEESIHKDIRVRWEPSNYVWAVAAKMQSKECVSDMLIAIGMNAELHTKRVITLSPEDADALLQSLKREESLSQEVRARILAALQPGEVKP